jgi:hypothetical protein
MSMPHGCTKGLTPCGSKKARCSVAAKELVAQWQQNSMPRSCSKKNGCSVTAKKHGVQWQQNDILLSGTQKPAAEWLQKRPVAQWQQTKNPAAQR